jgi:hypothetical protein
MTFSAPDLSRYLRSQGYATRTFRTHAGIKTVATKRQADHVQTYVYPMPNDDRQTGAVWLETFGTSVNADGVWQPRASDLSHGWIDGRDLGGYWGPENAIRESGGLDYYGPAEPAIYA